MLTILNTNRNSGLKLTKWAKLTNITKWAKLTNITKWAKLTNITKS